VATARPGRLVTILGKDVRVGGRLIRIARLDAEGYDFFDDPEAAADALRRSAIRADLLTFVPTLAERSPRRRYVVDDDNLAALPVSTFDHWWTRQINDKTRNMVRRAERKGIAVREVPFDEALVRGISAIYNECPVRQGKRFWHYGKDLDAVRRENETFLDRSIFLGAYVDERLVGFAKLVRDEVGGQVGLMKIQSLIQERDKAPTNALVAHAVRSCVARGIPYLWYASFSYGRKQRDTLSDFKKHNGFQRMELPRYYVPLTLLGRAALRLGLHHALVDRVPEPVLDQLRKLRNRWHGRRLLVARKAV
jgi:hypothetical protein